MSITNIARKFLAPRLKELERYAAHGVEIQAEMLKYLTQSAKDTEYGRRHIFGSITSYESFAANVPVNTYEDLKDGIDRMRHGEPSVMWPGVVKWYAKSSGTTNDKSKFIPVSREGLRNMHYQGARTPWPCTWATTPKAACSTERA